MHRIQADGSAALLLADDDPVLALLLRTRGGELSAMLEVTDRAPVDLREPVRALLWITGRIRQPDPAAARRIAVQVADTHPNPELLRLGHGATLLRLDPGFAVISDAEGTAVLAPIDLAAARPDPFCRYEQAWLAHLEQAHPEVFGALHRLLPRPLRDRRDARVRPLAVDRCGLRLRVETATGDHDVRLAWAQAASTAAELRTQLSLLVGCPYRRPVS